MYILILLVGVAYIEKLQTVFTAGRVKSGPSPNVYVKLNSRRNLSSIIVTLCAEFSTLDYCV